MEGAWNLKERPEHGIRKLQGRNLMGGGRETPIIYAHIDPQGERGGKGVGEKRVESCEQFARVLESIWRWSGVVRTQLTTPCSLSRYANRNLSEIERAHPIWFVLKS